MLLSKIETAERQWWVSSLPAIGAFPLQQQTRSPLAKHVLLYVLHQLVFTSRAMEMGVNVPIFSHH